MKVLIVDDESYLRGTLIGLCECSDDLQVVGEAACGRAAIEAARALHPDIIFFDVELPDMSGFELLRVAAAGPRPVGIMVGNCADHATKALAEGAIDFLVTPVTVERFNQAIARAFHRFNSELPVFRGANPNMPGLDHAVALSPRFLVGERQRRLYPLDPKSIEYIEADGNYVTLRAGKMEYLSRDSIKRLAMQLAGYGFVRIERSLLVNAAAVSYAEVAGHGTFALTLSSGVCLHSGASYRDSILRVIPLPGMSKRHRGA